MLILLMLALAGPPAIQAQTATLKPQSTSWFQQQPKPFGSSFRMEAAARIESSDAKSEATMDCKIRVLKADPNIDPKIARKPPENLDPKIVRPSPCRK